ncbi:hypothetical protein MGA3_11900 [Bacillus methanolicus MGA3]|nr:hypothetical protein MGA3_11900 [Bacillus methanolicus MGA3]
MNLDTLQLERIATGVSLLVVGIKDFGGKCYLNLMERDKILCLIVNS